MTLYSHQSSKIGGINKRYQTYVHNLISFEVILKVTKTPIFGFKKITVVSDWEE